VVWSNYVDIWREVPLGRIFLNSMKISGLSAVGQIFACSLAGFAFARLKFHGRNVLFIIVLATLMVPYHVTLIPTFLLFREIGWINTHYPLTVPAWFGGAFGIFMARQFFMTIPEELADAARVDGCNPARIFAQIFLPLAKPVMATLAIFTFLGSWNNLLLPLVYIREPDLMTFPVALSWLGGSFFFVNLPLMMAAAVVSIVPTLVIFALLQRYFVQGVVLSGMKV
jgi:ABC-type glycerol-3-phosphate transport system permease component